MLGNQETCKPIGLGNWLMWYTIRVYAKPNTPCYYKSQINATKIENWIDNFLKEMNWNLFFLKQ
jgi:hypothetical protein